MNDIINIGKWLKNTTGNITVGPVKTETYTIDGREYESLDDKSSGEVLGTQYLIITAV